MPPNTADTHVHQKDARRGRGESGKETVPLGQTMPRVWGRQEVGEGDQENNNKPNEWATSEAGTTGTALPSDNVQGVEH